MSRFVNETAAQEKNYSRDRQKQDYTPSSRSPAHLRVRLEYMAQNTAAVSAADRRCRVEVKHNLRFDFWLREAHDTADSACARKGFQVKNSL